MSNSKQVGTAMLLYVQDYDEQFPRGRYNPSAPNAADVGKGWAGQVYSYTKSVQVLKCPDDGTETVSASTTTPTLYPVSYIYNCDTPTAKARGLLGSTTLLAIPHEQVVEEVSPQAFRRSYPPRFPVPLGTFDFGFVILDFGGNNLKSAI